MHWLWSEEMDLPSQVQILDEAICVSFGSNALRKGINPSLLAAVDE